ncbi:hypothetical protein BN946_scf184830.g8 [Trametes cinnabarina]|uniref:C2H2-type domain-containing protein n=1 Tax=Pycnoporus cinnabarinus TaxID=5643 RepID=A0A060S9S6_PYCCI|nr:hypothetical protein BN946_scf184830.g8 [Trametes cinnabarina]
MSAPHSHLDHHNDPSALHRYQHQSASSTYYSHLAHPASQPALEPLSTSLPHTSYASRQQPWMLNVQTSYTHHPQHHSQQTNALADRTATNAQAHGGFYSGSAPEPHAGQMVGYPESSQRTPLLQDASYANLYNVPYTSVSFNSYQGGYSPAGSSPSDALQGVSGAYDSQNVSRGGGFRGVQGMPDRRQTYPPLVNTYLDGGRSDLYGPGAPARMTSQHAAPSAALGHLGGSSSAYSAPHAYGLGSPSSGYPHLTSDGTSLMDVHPSRNASASNPYPGPMRRDSMDSIADPISPSSVPGLVFDGDDYDDDSESSLPSAASEVNQRVPYRASQTSEDRDFDVGGSSSASTWSRTSMDGPYGAFKCPIPTCTKSFAVRSNAKRHLRTHGIYPSAEHGSTSPSQFTVGFDTPLVSDVHEAGKLPSKLRWVPPSLASRSNVDYLRDAASDSEDEYFQPSCPLLPLPLPPVTPSSPTWSPDEGYEERNSYEQADAAPYISSQWRALPGPAIASPTSF